MRKHSDLTKAEQAARVHYFKGYRRDGMPALLAWVSALRHSHFVATIRANVDAQNKRSAAANKAAKTRRANRLVAA